jgi:hypothetical protein
MKAEKALNEGFDDHPFYANNKNEYISDIT